MSVKDVTKITDGMSDRVLNLAQRRCVIRNLRFSIPYFPVIRKSTTPWPTCTWNWQRLPEFGCEPCHTITHGNCIVGDWQPPITFIGKYLCDEIVWPPQGMKTEILWWLLHVRVERSSQLIIYSMKYLYYLGKCTVRTAQCVFAILRSWMFHATNGIARSIWNVRDLTFIVR